MVEGRVVSADGNPAPDAKVTLVGEFPQELEVNPDGTFSFIHPMPGPWHQGPLLVMATDAPDSLAAMAEIVPGKKSLSLLLQSAAYVSATAVDTHGAPVRGTLFPIKCHDYIIAEGHADERGKVDIGPLPIGFPLEVQQEARSSALAVDEDWWKKAGSFVLRPGERHELPALVLDLNGRSVRLCTMDEKQQPVKDAFIYVTGRRDPARTDEKGQLELTGLPIRGKVTLCALHPTLPLFAVTTVDPDWKYWPGLILCPLRKATGKITDQHGKPVAGASIRFQNDDLLGTWFGEGDILGERLKAAGARDPVITDQEGRWQARFFIRDQKYDVMVTNPQGTGGSVVGTFTATGDEAVQDAGVMACPPQNSGEGK
jgi:hypothetical protein